MLHKIREMFGLLTPSQCAVSPCVELEALMALSPQLMRVVFWFGGFVCFVWCFLLVCLFSMGGGCDQTFPQSKR